MSDVRFERRGDLGLITLQRPQSINALTLDMVERIDDQLARWAVDPAVAMVVIDGDGERGLCAGGDIKGMYESAHGDGSHAREFWRVEYHLNGVIAAYPKPITSLMHGIVLGGGVGVSAHASLRVVTSNAGVGMPEVTIGLVPDVGATWLLSHAPGELGTHLALTGGSVGAADAILCGLADVHVPDAAIRVLREARDAPALIRLVDELSTPPSVGVLAEQRPWIDACYSADSVTEILNRLDASGILEAQTTADLIRTKSPTALAVTLRALRNARSLSSVHEALEVELFISSRCLHDHDLTEGIRAQVIDKDRRPKWDPPTLDGVREADVAAHFPG